MAKIDIIWTESRATPLAAVRDFALETYTTSKPLNYDEDNVATRYLDEEGWTVHRKRAWTTLMSGAHYDMIDFSILPHLETGTPASQKCIRTWMSHLSTFIHSVDLARARPRPSWLKKQPEKPSRRFWQWRGRITASIWPTDASEKKEIAASRSRELYVLPCRTGISRFLLTCRAQAPILRLCAYPGERQSWMYPYSPMIF